jgi:sulfopyruvate decarboxylase alpha subunit
MTSSGFRDICAWPATGCVAARKYHGVLRYNGNGPRATACWPGCQSGDLLFARGPHRGQSVRAGISGAAKTEAEQWELTMPMEAHADGEPSHWQNEVYRMLRRQGVTQFAYVPDAGHQILIDCSLADPDVYSVALTTEEEGVALLAGADLGGKRGVLLMQSSGVGNCVNMLSLISGCRFPFLTLISMRGDFGEGNPWQYPMGQATVPVLEAMGVMCFRADTPADAVETVDAALTMVFQAGRAVAVLFTQKLLGAKRF